MKLEKEIDKLFDLLEKNTNIYKLKQVKEKVLKDESLLTKIKKLQTLDIYTKEYQILKEELFHDENFRTFKHYENEINFLILEMNQKMKQLVQKEGCNHENH